MSHFILTFMLLSCLLGTTVSAFAAPLPNEALNQTYESCLSKIAGNDDGTSLEVKKNYCGCVRDKLAANWDTSKVDGMAKEYQASGKAPDVTVSELETIGRECISKILGNK